MGTPLRRFRQDARGVAAAEFALILPAMLALYFGMTEVVRIIEANRKLTLFARTLADLSGRMDSSADNDGQPSTSDMTAITAAASAILQPFSAASVQIVVSAMGVETIGGVLYGGVCSSWAQNASPRGYLTISGTNGLPAVPAVYRYDGARYLLAEVTMPYVPVLGANLYRSIFGTRGLSFTRQIPWAERTKTELVMPGGAACPQF